MPRRSILRGPRIDEVALCRSGVNQHADIVLYKAEDDPRFSKQDEGIPTFGDALAQRRAMEIDSALDARLFALLDTTTAIMRNDDPAAREELILAAVNAYAATMERDVPDLFAGRLAKALAKALEKAQPNVDWAFPVLKSHLSGAGLLPDATTGGNPMDFLKSLNEKTKKALGYVLGDRDPAAFFKGTSEDVGKLVAGLLDKAVEWAARVDDLEAQVEKFEKAKAAGPEPTGFDAILAKAEDPTVKAYLESQKVALDKTSKDVTELQKARRRDAYEAFAKGLAHLPNENGTLVTLMAKADEAGFLDDLKTTLSAADALAKAGKAFEDLGLSSEIGEGLTADAAHEALVGKAAEIRKSQTALSPEQAYDKACTENPDLFEATRVYPTQH